MEQSNLIELLQAAGKLHEIKGFRQVYKYIFFISVKLNDTDRYKSNQIQYDKKINEIEFPEYREKLESFLKNQGIGGRLYEFLIISAISLKFQVWKKENPILRMHEIVKTFEAFKDVQNIDSIILTFKLQKNRSKKPFKITNRKIIERIAKDMNSNTFSVSGIFRIKKGRPYKMQEHNIRVSTKALFKFLQNEKLIIAYKQRILFIIEFYKIIGVLPIEIPKDSTQSNIKNYYKDTVSNWIK